MSFCKMKIGRRAGIILKYMTSPLHVQNFVNRKKKLQIGSFFHYICRTSTQKGTGELVRKKARWKLHIAFGLPHDIFLILYTLFLHYPTFLTWVGDGVGCKMKNLEVRKTNITNLVNVPKYGGRSMKFLFCNAPSAVAPIPSRLLHTFCVRVCMSVRHRIIQHSCCCSTLMDTNSSHAAIAGKISSRLTLPLLSASHLCKIISKSSSVTTIRPAL